MIFFSWNPLCEISFSRYSDAINRGECRTKRSRIPTLRKLPLDNGHMWNVSDLDRGWYLRHSVRRCTHLYSIMWITVAENAFTRIECLVLCASSVYRTQCTMFYVTLHSKKIVLTHGLIAAVSNLAVSFRSSSKVNFHCSMVKRLRSKIYYYPNKFLQFVTFGIEGKRNIMKFPEISRRSRRFDRTVSSGYKKKLLLEIPIYFTFCDILIFNRANFVD